MKATLLLAGALAPLALATAASAYTPTPADLAQLKRLEGDWRSSSGYLLRARLSGDRLALTGHAPDSPQLTETFVVGAVARGSYEASWERWSGATRIGGSVSNLVLDTDRLSGRLADASGSAGSYVACRAGDSSADARAVDGIPFWMRPIQARLGDKGRGAVVEVTVQNVGPGKTTLILQALKAAYRNDRGQAVASSDVRVRNPTGGVFHMLPVDACATESFEIVFPSVPAGAHLLDLQIGGSTVGRWEFAAPPQPDGSSAPSPAPPPPPPPPPSPPTPAPPSPPSAPQPAPPVGGLPSGAGGWQQYGPNWSFKVDQLSPGPDGHWQAVISARSENRVKVGMVSNEIEAFLIDEDGESVGHAGNLYRASVTGPAAGLEPIPTVWMQQGDIVRVRLLFPRSSAFRPVRFRLKNNGGNPTIRNFPMN